MKGMGGKGKSAFSGRGLLSFRLLFPLAVVSLYAVLFMAFPAKAASAAAISLRIFRIILIPMSLVFFLMLLMNHFLNAAWVTKSLGGGSGMRGLMFSSAAGIISFGPIYAWYPLLKDLKGRGATDMNIALFLASRGIKPFLLPLMISYFGITYVAVLTFFMLASSLTVAALLDRMV